MWNIYNIYNIYMHIYVIQNYTNRNSPRDGFLHVRSALNIHTLLRDSHWAGSSQLASSRLQRHFPICSWIFSHLPSFLPVSKSALPSPLLSSQLLKIYHTRPTGISRPSPSPSTWCRPLAHFQLGEIKACDLPALSPSPWTSCLFW